MLNLKKPVFWIIIAVVVFCIVATVCFLINSKDAKDANLEDLQNASSETSMQVSDAVEQDISIFGEVVILSYSGPEFYMTPTVTLSKTNHSFELEFSKLDKYVITGDYKKVNNELVLTTSDESEKYIFREVGDTYVFDANKSSAVPKDKYVRGEKPKSPMPDGAVFEQKTVNSFYLDIIDSVTTDIDGDGKDEQCFLKPGPTSGLFTFGIYVLDAESENLKYANVFESEYYYLSFEKGSGGKIQVCGKTQDDEPVIHMFDISIRNGDIFLSENGVNVHYWVGQDDMILN